MKANELMVGDVVTFKDCQNDKEVITIKIWQINEDGDAIVSIDKEESLDAIVIDDEIVGIPLTPEILEKNDWKLYSHENTPIYGMIKGFEIVLAWMDCYWQLCVDGTLYRKIRIRYVHELRHALKLCGIKKEIEL